MSVTDLDLTALASSQDIISLGVAADEERRRRHGATTTFVRVADVTAAPGAVIDVPAGAGEIRIVGTPASGAAAVARVAEVAARAAGRPVSGFLLSDLEGLSAKEQTPLRGLLEALKAAGLDLVAEARFDLLRDPRMAIEEVNISGLALARLTVDSAATTDLVSLYRSIAELQRQVGVIRRFAPLPRSVNPASPTTGYDDIRRVALARLLVGNIPSIQVDWALYGPKLAQVALTVGADDLDGVNPSDDAAQGRRRSPLEEIRRNISAASLQAVERDGRGDPRPA
jgi:aminodeoxyfutalosine synthase